MTTGLNLSMNTFERLSNQNKLLTIAGNFLQSVGIVCVRGSNFVDGAYERNGTELKVGAHVLCLSDTAFVPNMAELTVADQHALAGIKVNKHWGKKQADWLEDEYVDYIIDTFIETYPIDLTRSPHNAHSALTQQNSM